MREEHARPGTYVLLLRGKRRGAIAIGRLGLLTLHRGFYLYVGSAFGPGGVAARLAHHARPAPHPHWHIDYLRRHIAITEVWCCYNTVPQEHAWARGLGKLPGAAIPLRGFGASDCDCPSHLYFFRDRAPRPTDLGTAIARTITQRHLLC